ncbi:Tuberous sclerosis 2 protein-like protein [Smittium culicis]|uniref:Tuberous sclerosis 2 protein-like protein n=1 Tax=Smittium culicis TaxID=133412 RepID=A0A1R1YF07_9FUNG|nr:Tuberous sclerosis 2 protein-like protein [Smittium culicis]
MSSQNVDKDKKKETIKSNKEYNNTSIGSVFNSVFRRNPNKSLKDNSNRSKNIDFVDKSVPYSSDEIISCENKADPQKIDLISENQIFPTIDSSATINNLSALDQNSIPPSLDNITPLKNNTLSNLLDHQEYSKENSDLELNMPQIDLVNNAQEIVAKVGDLSLQNAPIERRIGAIQRVIDIISTDDIYQNLSSIWDSVNDLCPLSSKNPDIMNILYKLIVAIYNSVKNSSSCYKNISNSFKESYLIEITLILISPTDWDSIVTSAQILPWSTNNGFIILQKNMQLFDTLFNWTCTSIEIFFTENNNQLNIENENNFNPEKMFSDSKSVLENCILLMNYQVKYNYPLLTDNGVSRVLEELCLKSQKMLLSGQELFTLNLNSLLAQIFDLIDSVANSGAIPLETLKVVVKLICYSITIDEYHEISCNIANKMILSSYIQEVAQCLMRIVMKKYPESNENIGTFIKNKPLTQSLGSENRIIRLAIIQGSVYSICSAMAEDVFKFLSYDTTVGIFLPTLLAALQVNKGYLELNSSSTIHPSSEISIDFNHSLYLTLRFLDNLLFKRQALELSPSSWGVIIDLVFCGIEFISAASENSMPKNSHSKILVHFYSILKSLYSAYEQGCCKDVHWMKNNIAKILFVSIRFDSFPDELAIALLNLSDASSHFSTRNVESQNILFTKVELFFFNTKKSLEIRRGAIDLVKTRVLSSYESFSDESDSKIITKIVSRLPFETDHQIIESIVTISERALEEGKGADYESILNVLKSVVSQAKANYDIYFSPPTTSEPYLSRKGSSDPEQVDNPSPSNNPHGQNTAAELPKINDVNGITIKSIPLSTHQSDTSISTNPNIQSFIKQDPVSLSDDDELFLVENNKFKATLVSTTLVRAMQVLLSGERASTFKKSNFYLNDLSYKYDFSNPELTSKLINAILDLSCNSDIDTKVRCILISSLFSLRADIYYRIYYSENEKSNPINNWRPMVRNPVFTEEIEELNQQKTKEGPQEFDTLTVCEKWGVFDVQNYLEKMTFILFQDPSYEVVLEVSRGLEDQLCNIYLFWTCSAQIQKFITLLSPALDSDKFGVREYWKSKLDTDTRIELTILGYRLLTRTILYSRIINLSLRNRLVNSFQVGLGKGSFKISRPCIHALNICMLEIPIVFRKQLPAILTRLVQTHNANSMNVHILEFISAISRQPDMLANLVINDLKLLLQIPLNYIKVYYSQKSRLNSISSYNSSSPSLNPNFDKDYNSQKNLNVPTRPSAPRSYSIRKSIGSKDIEKVRSNTSKESDSVDSSRLEYNFISGKEIISNDPATEYYVLVMAYQTIDIIFLSLRSEKKLNVLATLLQGLLSSNSYSQELNEMNIVCIDAIFRFLFMRSDHILDRKEVVTEEDLNETVEYSWIQSCGIKTIRAQKNGRLAQIIVQRACSMSSTVVDLPKMALEIFCENKNSPNSFFDIAISNDKEGQSYLSNKAVSEHLPISALNSVLHGKTVQVNVKNKLLHLPVVVSSQKSFVDELISLFPRLVGIDHPTFIPNNPRTQRALSVMRISPTIDTHKIGVIYAGPKQTGENEILSNTHGSSAYWAFLRGLGKVVRLSQVTGYSGGLDTTGADTDGRFGIQWNDCISNIFFHVATMMPTHDNKESGSVTQHLKKAHIGNDFVHIVFNESGDEYSLNTLASQFNFVQIIVTPGDISSKSPDLIDEFDDSKKPIVRGERLYYVRTQISDELPPIGPAMYPKLVTLSALPGLVRIAAIHANIFVQVYLAIKKHAAREYVSTWRQRLRGIRRLRDAAFVKTETSPSATENDIPSPSLLRDTSFHPISTALESQNSPLSSGNLNNQYPFSSSMGKSIIPIEAFIDSPNMNLEDKRGLHNRPPLNKPTRASLFSSASNSPRKTDSPFTFSPNLIKIDSMKNKSAITPIIDNPSSVFTFKSPDTSENIQTTTNIAQNLTNINSMATEVNLQANNVEPCFDADILTNRITRKTSDKSKLEPLIISPHNEESSDKLKPGVIDLCMFSKLMDESMIKSNDTGLVNSQNKSRHRPTPSEDLNLPKPIQKTDYSSYNFINSDRIEFTDDQVHETQFEICKDGISNQSYISQIDKSCLSGINIFDPDITASKILESIVSNIGSRNNW